MTLMTPMTYRIFFKHVSLQLTDNQRRKVKSQKIGRFLQIFAPRRGKKFGGVEEN